MSINTWTFIKMNTFALPISHASPTAQESAKQKLIYYNILYACLAASRRRTHLEGPRPAVSLFRLRLTCVEIGRLARI